MGSNYFQNGLEILICIYTTIKHCLKVIPPVNKALETAIFHALFVVLCVLLSALTLLIIVLTLLLINIFKFALKHYLKSKYKENFLEYMEIGDAYWVVEKETARSVINIIMVAEFKKSEGDLTKFVKEMMTSLVTTPRFTSVRKSCMGYHFFVSNQLTLDDIVRDMEPYGTGACDKDAFEKMIQRYANTPLPKGDTAACEVLVGQQPVKITPADEVEQYPVMLRIHHSVGDGTALVSHMIAHSDEGISVLKNLPEKTEKAIGKKRSLSDEILGVCKKIQKAVTAGLYISLFTDKPDVNFLHGKKLSGDKILACNVEESARYVAKVKAIKNKIPGTNFTEVILTALSASLEEYFRKNAPERPDVIKLVFTLTLDRENLSYRARRLVNTFSASHMYLPLSINDGAEKPTKFINRFKFVHEELDKFQKSLDMLVMHWQLRLFGDKLPTPMMKLLLKLNVIDTVSFSNLPSFPKIGFLGHKINHTMFWTPHVNELGLGVSVLTYDDRFHVGLIADKALIPDNESAGSILSNIFKYVDQMEAELQET